VPAANRVGIGYDIHRLVDGRRLVIGGVDIPHAKGLFGHSDADVVLHAVTDALLGAAGLPDIGDLFPDTDPKYENADSRDLLHHVMRRLAERGLAPANVDVIIHAEAPRLTPYKRPIAESIAGLIGIPPDRVSVKAKTNEGLGALGVADAIACTAVALLVEKT
jgi:2-C-methyl-D-erythritol 2,4-cyclodiphosphate synthase